MIYIFWYYAFFLLFIFKTTKEERPATVFVYFIFFCVCVTIVITQFLFFWNTKMRINRNVIVMNSELDFRLMFF